MCPAVIFAYAANQNCTRLPNTQNPRVTRRAWETVAVDLMGTYPRTCNGNRFILVAIDLFTRWVEAFPLRSYEAPRLNRLLQEEVLSCYGYSNHLLSNNGPSSHATYGVMQASAGTVNYERRQYIIQRQIPRSARIKS